MSAFTPAPPDAPAPTRSGKAPKRWYHQWTPLQREPKREARHPPLRWRVVMALLPWRVRMRLLSRWAKR